MQNVSTSLALGAALLVAPFACAAQALPDIPALPDQASYTTEAVVADTGVVWSMDWLPNGDLLFTERSGQLRMVKDGQLLEQPIQGLPRIDPNRQGGLLEVRVHPNYAENGWIYFTFSDPAGEGEGSGLTLARAQLDSTQLVNLERLYQAGPNSELGFHYAGKIVFDGQGHVYFSIGDRGQRDVYPQDITADNGKIYRLYEDGSIPDDNPLVGEGDAKSAIFSYGHRNPQGLAQHPQTGAIWSHEHGPRGGDEINLIEPGKNYGWPVISYGINYNGTPFTDKTEQDGMEQPLHYWDPSIAPSGMAFVTSDRYPDWQGKLLVGSLKFQHLVLLDLDGTEITAEHKLLEGIGRMREVREAPDGYLYVGTDGAGIHRIVPTG
jgi:glucose/arabinose dehydrogenase